MARSAEINTDFYCTASFHAVAHSTEPNPPQWPIAHNQIRAVTHSAKYNSPQWPTAQKYLRSRISRQIRVNIWNCFRLRTEDLLRAFGEITLDKKSLGIVPLT